MNHALRPLAILTALALASTALPAFAEQVTLRATLSGSEEVPPNDATATGTLEATYDTETNALSFTVSFDGLTGEATAAHFHGPAAPGANAGPVVPIEGALASPISGTATLSDGQEADLLGGMWYFNVHTAQYPDGEIRGQVLQSMTSSEASMASSEQAPMSSEAPPDSSSASIDPSVSVSVSASVSVDPSSDLSSISSEVSSGLSSVSSELSSTLSSLSSELDPSLSVSVSVSASGEVSVSAP